ncbi:hypothetical protein OPT61_g6871 [Boeremia exigua]|uniref:Uncharacterized protein n=1 Tax=Boeremia exigua TaxID=749465 RepID=A0ACC2I4F6_9PLEO|nr:hypothetical protein OPT61_g6871 [Boeremia exigua]
MSLLGLPNELLQGIAKNIQTEKDISSFSRVNRRLYNVSIASLYRFNAEHTGRSALVWAAANGMTGTAERSLKAEPLDQDYREDDDGSQMTPVGTVALVLAARNNHADLVRLLIENGVEPDEPDLDQMRNAMEAAAEEGHTGIATLLLELGADASEGLGGAPFAIQHAAMGGHIEIVRMLIDGGEHPDRCSGRPGGGSYSPLQAAALTDNEELARMLLDRGARVDHRSASSDTPLELAVWKKSLRCIKVLLEAGAKVYGKNDYYVSRPALEMARERGREECLEMLQNETVHVYSEQEDDRFAEQ